LLALLKENFGTEFCGSVYIFLFVCQITNKNNRDVHTRENLVHTPEKKEKKGKKENQKGRKNKEARVHLFTTCR
jgi:hypothetical protein